MAQTVNLSTERNVFRSDKSTFPCTRKLSLLMALISPFSSNYPFSGANHLNVIILLVHRNEPCPLLQWIFIAQRKAVDCLLPPGQTIWTSSICISKDVWKRHFKGTSSRIPFVFSAGLMTVPTYPLPSLGLTYINKYFLAAHLGERMAPWHPSRQCFNVFINAWRWNDVGKKMCWKMCQNIRAQVK